jgi:hypothetical protein
MPEARCKNKKPVAKHKDVRLRASGMCCTIGMALRLGLQSLCECFQTHTLEKQTQLKSNTCMHKVNCAMLVMALAICISAPAPAQQSSHRSGLWLSGRRPRTWRDAIHNGTCQCSSPGIFGAGSADNDLDKTRRQRSARPAETDEDRDTERLLLRLRLRVARGNGPEARRVVLPPLQPLPLG